MICDGATSIEESCNVQECPGYIFAAPIFSRFLHCYKITSPPLNKHRPNIVSVDCVWGNWQNGTCSKTCGDGEVTRTRSKKVEAANGGKDCDGESVVLENCTSQPCPRKYF